MSRKGTTPGFQTSRSATPLFAVSAAGPQKWRYHPAEKPARLLNPSYGTPAYQVSTKNYLDKKILWNWKTILSAPGDIGLITSFLGNPKSRFDESIWMDGGNTRSTSPPPLWSSTAPHRLWHSLGVEVEGMMTDNATSKTRGYCTTKFGWFAIQISKMTWNHEDDD